jgi:hypothetical protein
MLLGGGDDAADAAATAESEPAAIKMTTNGRITRRSVIAPPLLRAFGVA